MTEDDELRHATGKQIQAARRFFARHPRPVDGRAKYDAAEAEEQIQDDRWTNLGGNR